MHNVDTSPLRTYLIPQKFKKGIISLHKTHLYLLKGNFENVVWLYYYNFNGHRLSFSLPIKKGIDIYLLV